MADIPGSANSEQLTGTEFDDNIRGEGGNDTIFGGAGNDRIIADDPFDTPGNNLLYGEEGNDTLSPGEGFDTLFGGSGNDVLFGANGFGGRASLDGGAGDDTFILTDNDSGKSQDLIFGGDGTDTIELRSGVFSDRLIIDLGMSIEVLDLGNDIIGNDGPNTFSFVGVQSVINSGLDGGAIRMNGGNDTFRGSSSGEYVLAGPGDDSVQTFGGNDTLIGQGGNDTLDGGEGDDLFRTISVDSADQVSYLGGSGQDTLEFLEDYNGSLILDQAASIEVLNTQDYQLLGSDSDDTVNLTGVQQVQGILVADMNLGNDQFFGSAFNDIARGGEGNDTLLGYAGDDILIGGGGEDSINGGEGNDTLAINAMDGRISTLFGGDGDDLISGAIGENVYLGGEGSDTLTVDLGVIELILDSNASIETLDFQGTTINGSGLSDTVDLSGVRVFANQALFHLGEGNDTYAGAGPADSVDGGSGNDTISSAAGNDTVLGGLGDDRIDGGLGADLLTGGDGVDTFVLAGNMGNDTITDFSFGVDQFDTSMLPTGATLEAVTTVNAQGDRVWTVSEGNSITFLGVPQNYDALGILTVTGTATEGETLSYTLADVIDLDGLSEDALFAQWLRDGDAIEGATGQSYQLSQADVGAAISVALSGQDGFGNTETLTSTATSEIVNVNDPTIGVPTISGSTEVGSTLTVATGALSDEDGLGSFTYQWLRSGDVIEGAISGVYSLVAEDAGSTVSVRVTYEDQQGTSEAVVSATSSVITRSDLDLTGTGDGDRLVGEGGNDKINGGDGPDTIIGGEGNDTLIGGTSEDDLRDVIFGGAGNDLIDGGYGNDELRGDAGNDTIAGGFGADTVIGGTGDDVLTGSALGDNLFGGTGDDFVNGGFGFDRVNGGAGADEFFHIGIADHGSDWIQDYSALEGDVLVFGNASATRAQFQINTTTTPMAGADDVEEAFIIYRPTGQIMWALVDGDGQDEINLRIGGDVFDLMA